eukprot:188357_1
MPNSDKLGNGIKPITPDWDSKKSFCALQNQLFRVYVRNEHTLLAIMQRTAGTNFSIRQRLGCFFMYLCTMMAVTAVFYGVEQEQIFGDVTASFLISFIGTTPSIVIKKIFEKSKPQIIKSKTKSVKKVRKLQKKEGDDENGHGKRLSKNVQINEVNEMLTDTGSKLEVVRLTHEVRQAIFKQNYPLHSKCKKVAWILLIVWTIGTIIIALLYGIQFDLLYDSVPNDQNSHIERFNQNCWSVDMQLRIESDLSDLQLLETREAQNSNFVDNFYGNASRDSQTWLLSLVESLFTSIMFWQPLMIYLVTFLKIWLFTWHLTMKLGPGNLFQLCIKCCSCHCIKCCVGDRIEVADQSILNGLVRQLTVAKMKSVAPIDENDETDIIIRKNTEFVAHEERPLDIIGFLANDQLFVDDYDKPVFKAKKKLSTTTEKTGEQIELETVTKKKSKDMKEKKLESKTKNTNAKKESSAKTAKTGEQIELQLDTNKKKKLVDKKDANANAKDKKNGNANSKVSSKDKTGANSKDKKKNI